MEKLFPLTTRRWSSYNDSASHILLKTREGSAKIGSGKCYRASCRNCPNSKITKSQQNSVNIRLRNRDTNYYCSKCLVCIHLECFKAFHDANKHINVIPNKKLQNINNIH